MRGILNKQIRSISTKRAYLARLYSLCVNFAEDDIFASIINGNIIFGGMSPKSSFEFSIREPHLKSLFDDYGISSKEPVNIYFTVSKYDFSKILAPFSKSGSSERPKKDTDMVSLEISDSGVRFIQDNLHHESIEIRARSGEGAWPLLPTEDWEFTFSSDMLSDYILRMGASGGPTITFTQEGDTLWIISDAGKEKIPFQASKSLSSHVAVSRMALLKVKAQLNGYENIKVGIRNYFLMIEGRWKQGVCKWKLDAI